MKKLEEKIYLLKRVLKESRKQYWEKGLQEEKLMKKIHKTICIVLMKREQQQEMGFSFDETSDLENFL